MLLKTMITFVLQLKYNYESVTYKNEIKFLNKYTSTLLTCNAYSMALTKILMVRGVTAPGIISLQQPKYLNMLFSKQQTIMTSLKQLYDNGIYRKCLGCD